MKYWMGCDPNIRMDIGSNFAKCFFGYYLFPMIILLILLIIGVIIYQKRTSPYLNKESSK